MRGIVGHVDAHQVRAGVAHRIAHRFLRDAQQLVFVLRAFEDPRGGQRLGFRLSDRYPGRGHFLRCSARGGHHDLFLLQTPEAKRGLNHVAFTVRDIQVDGVQRTEAGTIFSYLPIKVGDEIAPLIGAGPNEVAMVKAMGGYAVKVERRLPDGLRRRPDLLAS